MLRYLFVLAVAAAALYGCGGSGSTSAGTDSTASSSPAPVVTRASYIEEADVVCKRSNQVIRRRNAQIKKKVDAATDDDAVLNAIKTDLREGYTAQRELVAELDRIKKPPEDAAVIEKLSEAADEQTALIGRLADAAESGDVSRFTSLGAELTSARTRYRGLAQGYGFRECGSGKSDTS